jgi:hypothetical protein
VIRAALTGDLLGRFVEITSRGGIVYRGTVREIRHSDDGEMFALAPATSASNERLVYVTNRVEQIRLVSP